MPITDINKGCVVVGFQQFEVEQLAIKEVPGTAHMPRDRGTNTIVGKDGMF